MIPSSKKLQFYSPNVQTDVGNCNHRLCCYCWPLCILSASDACVCTLLPLLAFPTHLRYLSEGWRMLYTRWEDSSTSYKFKGSLNLLVSLIQRTHTHTWESVFFPEMTSFNRAFPVKRKKWKWKARCDSRLSFDVHRWSLTDRFWMN